MSYENTATERERVIKETIEFIRSNFKQHFYIARNAISIGDEMLRNREHGIIYDINNEFGRFLILKLAKNICRMKSILLLSEHGFARDTIPLLRVMFEEIIDAKYISLDRTRMKDYLDYGDYTYLKILRMGQPYIKKQKDRIASQNIVENSEDKFQELGKKFNKYRRWSKDDLRKLCETKGIDMKKHYVTMFKLSSQYVHSSSISDQNYISRYSTVDVDIDVGSNTTWVEEALLTSVAYFLDLLTFVSNEFQTVHGEKIEQLGDELNQLANLR